MNKIVSTIVVALLLPELAHAQSDRMDLETFLTVAGSQQWEEEGQLRGSVAGFQEIDTLITERWDSCQRREKPIPLAALNVIRYRFLYERWNQGRTLAYAVLVWDDIYGPCAEPRPPPPPDTITRGFRTGIVRQVTGTSMIEDDGGIFLGLGATYMPAVYYEQADPQRLDEEMAALRQASKGAVDYVRILGTLGGPCDSYWQEIQWNPMDADYETRLARTIDRIYDKHGMRSQVTLFGGDCHDDVRRETIDKILRVANARPHKIMHLELCNECWQTEYAGLFDEMIADVQYLVDRSQWLVASSAAPSVLCDTGPDNWTQWNPNSTMFVAHYDREIGLGDGIWRTVRQPWETLFCDTVPRVQSSNEPIGPGSSVDTLDDVDALVMSPINAYVADHSFYVYHSAAGVRNRDGERFRDMPNFAATMAGYDAMKDYMPADAVGWDEQNSHWSNHPFELIPNWVEFGGTEGAVRAYAIVQGDQSFTFPIGIRGDGGITLRPKANMHLTFIETATGAVLHSQDLDVGQSFRVDGSRSSMVIKGRLRR